MPRRGFTLVELLVVIGVITILSAMAIPAITFARRKAQDAKCVTLISQVQAGLESFRTSVGTYPEGPAGRSTNGGIAAIASTDAASSWSMGLGRGDAVKPVETVTEDTWRSINRDLLQLLSMVAGNEFRITPDNPYLYDPYSGGGEQKVLRYRPSRYFRFDGNATNIVDQDDPPGRDSYQLWSCGRDGIDQFGAKASDDMTSWTKR